VRKFLKAFFAGGVVLSILLTCSLNAFAIGFDAETAYNSIFVIQSGNSIGSGFAYGENGIITNAHVIANKNEIYVTDYNGNLVQAFVVAMDEEIDIAVIGVQGATYTPVKPTDIYGIAAGDDVYAIGAPNSMAYTLTKGVISSKYRKVGGMSYIQTDAAINNGNSGGPLLDNTGNVVGVNSIKVSNNEGIGLAIPITTVMEYLKEQNIQLDDSGNIADSLVPEPRPASSIEKENNIIDAKSHNLTTVVLLSALAVSVIFNIILIILLVYQKRKNLDLSKERTDFDIDILE